LPLVLKVPKQQDHHCLQNRAGPKVLTRGRIGVLR
jgi:hypothetical protein